MNKNKGILIVISGPSGVGKSTLRERLINENNNFWYSISMTTRKPRILEKTNKLEENGKDYFFVTEDEFKENIKNGNFFEYAQVYDGLYYGTPKNKVLEMLDKGYNVILEIDVDGALEIKEKYNEALLVFIKPESLSVLENRLLNRNSDNLKDIKKRLDKASYEISYSDKYDYVITSKTKEEDYNNLINIINNEIKTRQN